MPRIPFKRQFIILGACILLIGIMVPIATFANGTPPGEQKQAHVHPVVAAQGQPTPITADCSGPQLLTTLNKGDVFNASATLTSSDPNEGGEGENLQILDASTNPPTVLLNLAVNTGGATIKPFTATVANDLIQACIIGIDPDETGTVTFTVTPGSSNEADLVVTKSVADPAPKFQGDEVDYQITVQNNGPSDATNVILTDVIPDGIFVANPAQTSQGECTASISTISCNLGTIANSKSAQVFITASVFRIGNTINTATAKADQKDPNPASNTSSAKITVQAAPTSLTLENALHKLGIALKAAGVVYGLGKCYAGEFAECTIVGNEFLAEHPGVTGQRAAAILRIQVTTLCVTGLALDDPEECTSLAIYVLSELLAPPPAG